MVGAGGQPAPICCWRPLPQRWASLETSQGHPITGNNIQYWVALRRPGLFLQPLHPAFGQQGSLDSRSPLVGCRVYSERFSLKRRSGCLILEAPAAGRACFPATARGGPVVRPWVNLGVETGARGRGTRLPSRLGTGIRARGLVPASSAKPARSLMVARPARDLNRRRAWTASTGRRLG